MTNLPHFQGQTPEFVLRRRSSGLFQPIMANSGRFSSISPDHHQICPILAGFWESPIKSLFLSGKYGGNSKIGPYNPPEFDLSGLGNCAKDPVTCRDTRSGGPLVSGGVRRPSLMPCMTVGAR